MTSSENLCSSEILMRKKSIIIVVATFRCFGFNIRIMFKRRETKRNCILHSCSSLPEKVSYLSLTQLDTINFPDEHIEKFRSLRSFSERFINHVFQANIALA